jgi:hypothetical protein
MCLFTVNTTMTHSLLLSTLGLERVTDWLQRHDLSMRIFDVYNDCYAVVFNCSERDAVYLSLLAH